jgi:uncharacterized protein (TIGR03086 family)
MEPTEQLAVIIPALTDLVDRIEADQLDNATPCANFDVQGVLDHMIGGATSFVPAFRGESQPQSATAPAAVAPGQVPAAEFRFAMESLLAAVSSAGAMERTISAPFGDVPGSVFARFVAFDGLIHGWDLASGTGQAYSLPEPVIAAVDGFARDAVAPEMRDGDTFAAETRAPDGSSRLEQLVAFSGRSV